MPLRCECVYVAHVSADVFSRPRTRRKMRSFILFPSTFTTLPCPVCSVCLSVCVTPLTLVCSPVSRPRPCWLTLKKWALFNDFIPSHLFFHPLSLSDLLSVQRAPLCVCVRARSSTHAWMCAKCHCHSWVWRIFYGQGFLWAYEGMCRPETDEEKKRIIEQM